jgi:hypothetical protein
VSRAGTIITCRCLNLLETIDYYRDLFPTLLSYKNLNYRGIHLIISLFISFPPRVTQDSPHEVITSPLKQQEYLYEVTMGRCSLSYIVVWVGIFPTYNVCDSREITPKFFLRCSNASLGGVLVNMSTIYSFEPTYSNLTFFSLSFSLKK